MKSDQMYSIEKLNDGSLPEYKMYSIFRYSSYFKYSEKYTLMIRNRSLLTASVRNRKKSKNKIRIYHNGIKIGVIIRNGNNFHIVDSFNCYLGMIIVNHHPTKAAEYTFLFNSNMRESYHEQKLTTFKKAMNKKPRELEIGWGLAVGNKNCIPSSKNYQMIDVDGTVFYENTRVSKNEFNVTCIQDFSDLWAFSGMIVSCLFK